MRDEVVDSGVVAVVVVAVVVVAVVAVVAVVGCGLWVFGCG